MNYKSIYYALVESRKNLNRKKKKGNSYERHHIIPKSCGGTNERINIVLLTPKEHFLAHKLLAEMYEGALKMKMKYALWMMCHVKNKYYGSLSSSGYQKLKEELSKIRPGRPAFFKGRKHTEEAKASMKNKRKGIKFPPEFGKNISNRMKGRKLSPERIECLRKANLGRKLSEDHKAKLKITSTGRIKSIEEREKISSTQKGKKGKKWSAERVEKHRQERIGKPLSEKAKENMSKAQKGRIITAEHAEKLSAARIKYYKEKGGRKVIDTHTGIVYQQLNLAAEAMNIKLGTFRSYLDGRAPNKTNCKYF